MASEKRINTGFMAERKILEAADRLASERDRSRSAVIRLALREYVEREMDVKESANGQQSRT